MHYLADYGLYFAKIATLVIAILIVVGVVMGLASRNKGEQKGKLSIKKINDKYQDAIELLNETILDKKAFKTWRKNKKQEEKAEEKNPTEKKHVYVLDFIGDIRASAVENLREEITAVLSIATPKDEVIVRLDSPGGMVNTYGLAASQLQRIRDKHIPLTVIVDKVAASGGYLMACVANKILAAPFAIIGSIGVVAQLPNFHRLLKKKDIDYELITAGEYKRTLTMFGENTDKAREKFQEQIQDIHDHFKDFIHKNRAIVNLPEVATGEYWLASKALDLKLVDELTTSDDYLFTQSHTSDIYHVQHRIRKSVGSRLASFAQNQMADLHLLFK